MVWRAMEIVLTYKMKHDWDVKGLLTAYKRVLQRAIDIIWENTEWKERRVKHNGYKTTRLIPFFQARMSSRRILEASSSKIGHTQHTTWTLR